MLPSILLHGIIVCGWITHQIELWALHKLNRHYMVCFFFPLLTRFSCYMCAFFPFFSMHKCNEIKSIKLYFGCQWSTLLFRSNIISTFIVIHLEHFLCIRLYFAFLFSLSSFATCIITMLNTYTFRKMCWASEFHQFLTKFISYIVKKKAQEPKIDLCMEKTRTNCQKSNEFGTDEPNKLDEHFLGQANE